MPGIRSVRLAALAAVAMALTPAATSAAPYEQINRTTGAFGTSPLWGVRDQGTAVGDLGRYAGWERVASVGEGTPVPQGFVRDIQLNRTLDYGGNVQRIYGFDRLEQRALILRTRAGQRQVVAVPIAGGAPIIIAQFPVGGRLPEAALSGNGRVAVVSTEGWGTKVFDLTGGTARLTRTLTSKYFERFPARGISDAGNTVLGYDPNETSLLTVYRNGVERVLPERATTGAVSADGATIAWVADREGFYDLHLRNLATSTQRTFPLPTNDPRGSAEAAWVANGGTKVVVHYGGLVEAQEFTPGSGSTGTWTRFGAAPYSNAFQSEFQRSPLSANRRFAVTGGYQMSRAVALFDVTGQHIVGANEGFSAATYIRGGSFVSTCDQPTEFYVALGQPTLYAPNPVKAVITAKVDGQTIAAGTLTKPLPYGFSGPLPEDDPTILIRGTYGPASTSGEVQLTASVTDAAGRVLTETWSEPDLDCAG